jgi:cellulose synthase operon protein C
VAAARAGFSKALELNPGYVPAAFNLATLDLAEKKPQDARKRLETVVEKDPKNEQGYLALAQVLARTGGTPADITAVLARAVAANPQSVSARLALIGFNTRADDKKAALAAATDAASAIPGDPRILESLGLTQEAAGASNQAVETFNKLVALQPGVAQPLIRLAGLYARQKDTDKAIDTLRRAQKVSANPREIVPNLVQVLVAANRFDDATAEVVKLQRAEPSYAGGFAMHGDILASQRKLAEAEGKYRDALKIEPKGNSIAIRLHGALAEQSKTAEADALAKRWLSDNPKDVPMRMYLGDRDLRAKNYKSAAAHYQSVVALEGENVIALNNLAWLSGELGDAKAMSYAERAVKLAPNSPAILDTFGMLLVKRGDVDKGVLVMKRVQELAPQRHDLRLNYAKALLKAGRKDDARKELEALKAVSEDFPGKDELATLLKQ